MTLSEVVDRLGLEVVAGGNLLDIQVSGGYVGDLLSNVMANAQKGQVWLTVQGHVNVVAVATLRELAGVVLVGGRQPSEDTIAKADEEGLAVMKSELGAFELAGRLYGLL